MYNTSSCSVQTETFSARYRLQKFYASGTYVFTIGGDDGYRFSLDGGATWVVNKWFDQSYNVTSYSTSLNGTYNMVLEYYENAGGNRVSFSVAGSALPVELLKFDASPAGTQIKLNWITTKEINAANYEIERSSNGIDFSTIGSVPASGQTNTTSQELSYQYTDAAPPDGIHYYRLRMIDIDGKYSYSPVVKASVNNDKGIRIYPTIVSRNQSITLQTTLSLPHASITLYDLSGRVLPGVEYKGAIAAHQPVSISLNHLPLSAGTYIIVCRDGDTILKKQLVLIQ